MAKPERENSGFFAALVHDSLILQTLDRFTAWIYALLSKGFFGWLFGGYPDRWKSGLLESRAGAGTHFSEFRYGICRRIESSAVLAAIRWLIDYLLNCRLKVYGCFLASFGGYTEVLVLIRALAENRTADIPTESIIPGILIVASIPLLLSGKTLADAVTDSVIGRLILSFCGFPTDNRQTAEESTGHSVSAFLIGLIAGLLTYFVSPLYILGAVVAAVWAVLVMFRPEIGVLTLFAAVPWLPTMVLAGIVIYTALSWGVKLFRGKRSVRFEAADVAVFGYMLFLFGGGIVSLSSSSLKPALLMICLTAGYFLAVGLLGSREWLIRASTLTVLSAAAESLWALYLHFTGGGYSSRAWLDSEMFSSIGSRAVGSLDNPNMLGEYLVLIIPIAVAMVVGRKEGLRRFPAFLCCCALGVCLIMTWSRGAWIALILAALVFLLMWHHRSLWLVIAGIASIPILPSVLPASIINRFASIGNMADSSTSYRVYIWRASVHMIEDNLFTGIGIGEGAWNNLYPLYALEGIGEAPHSHNLFLQIWLETGVFGLLAFLAFIFLLFQAGFTFFSKLSSRRGLKSPDISADCLTSDAAAASAKQMKRSMMQLRLSVIGPLSGIIAVLVQGMTDYAFYNYRLTLMFWLVAGLALGYIRDGREKIGSAYDYTSGTSSFDTERTVLPASREMKNKKKEK